MFDLENLTWQQECCLRCRCPSSELPNFAFRKPGSRSIHYHSVCPFSFFESTQPLRALRFSITGLTDKSIERV